ncbi:hypothetical protein [Spirosoma koreense]
MILFLVSPFTFAQQVANYSYGKPGSDTYEEIGFWVRSNKPSDINYLYGKDRKETKLRYAGKGRLNGEAGFKVRFPNGLTLYVVPKKADLLLSDLAGKYVRRFTWHYEGPVDGIGTFCQPCAPDQKAAMNLMRHYFLN